MHATSGTDDKARVGDAFPALELAPTSSQLVTVPDRLSSLLSSRALGAVIAGEAAALKNHSTKRGALGPVKPTGGRLGLSADF